MTADCAASVGWRSVGYVDAPELLESTGRECLGLLEDPRLVGLLQAAVGNDAHLINLQASIGPPSDELHVGTRLQREYWREDGSGALQRGSFVHPVLSEGVKVIIALSDQDSCATYVPHTNRCPEEPHSNGPSRVWKAKRGDAMLMDVRTWHSAFSPAMEQGSLILYAGAFNKKPMAGVAKVVAQLNSSGALSPLARQILGVYEGAPGNHMHRGGEQIQFAPPVPSPQNRSTADIIESIPRLDFDAGHNDAPQSLDDQVQHMRDWGYVRLKSFVAPTTLAELQSEFHKEQDAVLNDIVRAQDNSTALAKLPVLTTDAVLPKMFDLPFGEGQVLEGDMGAPLLKIIESAGPLVARVVGRDAQVINIQPRTVPANEDLMQKVKAGGEPSTTGYTGWCAAFFFGSHWQYSTSRNSSSASTRADNFHLLRNITVWLFWIRHRDEGSANGVFVHPLITTNVKLIVAVSSQQGGLEGSTVLPGTHRVHESPASQSGHEGKFLVSEIEESHERVFVGDAGDAVLFDTKYVVYIGCCYSAQKISCSAFVHMTRDCAACVHQDMAQSAAKPFRCTARVLHHTLFAI